MDSTPTCLDFAIIGHQDNWTTISGFINSLRGETESITIGQIKDLYSYIPPRDVFRIKVKSLTGEEVNGVFIETFIDPDRLATNFAKSNILKVKNAANCAKKMGAKIVTLGGFTSIVLEGNLDSLSTASTKFTTGNTLTSAYIVKGIEKAAAEKNILLQDASLLIIGATGDIGQACTHYFKHKVKRLLLNARNESRLQALSKALSLQECGSTYSTNLSEIIPDADIVISVASSAGISAESCKPGALICDAGYPKNLGESLPASFTASYYHGGMGFVQQGFSLSPDYSDNFYRYAFPHVAHGCVLEAIVLALEKKPENYSWGKGNIITERIEHIYALSLKHGISLAPFYNDNGLWNDQIKSKTS